FHFIKIDIVPTARVTDDYKRLRSDASPSQCPQIFVIVKRRTVTDRADVQFPRSRRGNDNEHNNHSNPAPLDWRNRALKFRRRPAVDLFGPRRFSEKQPRKAESLFKIGNK